MGTRTFKSWTVSNAMCSDCSSGNFLEGIVTLAIFLKKSFFFSENRVSQWQAQDKSKREDRTQSKLISLKDQKCATSFRSTSSSSPLERMARSPAKARTRIAVTDAADTQQHSWKRCMHASRFHDRPHSAIMITSVLSNPVTSFYT